MIPTIRLHFLSFRGIQGNGAIAFVFFTFAATSLWRQLSRVSDFSGIDAALFNALGWVDICSILKKTVVTS